MPKPPRRTRIDRHKNLSIRATGMTRGKSSMILGMVRKDGARLRSGHFDMGERVGEWTTYDAKGKIYKVTRFSTW